MSDWSDADDRRSLIYGKSQKPSKPTAPVGTSTKKATDNLCGVPPVISNSGMQTAAVPAPVGSLQVPREPALERLYSSGEAGKVLGGLTSKTMRNLAGQGVFTDDETWLDGGTHRVFTEAGLRRVRALRKANGANSRRQLPSRKPSGPSSGGAPAQPSID